MVEEYLDEVEHVGDDEIDADGQENEEGDEEVSPHCHKGRRALGCACCSWAEEST